MTARFFMNDPTPRGLDHLLLQRALIQPSLADAAVAPIDRGVRRACLPEAMNDSPMRRWISTLSKLKSAILDPARPRIGERSHG
jgi:hypothetical protein